MDKLKERLVKNISGTDLFIILGTRHYVRSLKETDESIAIQIDTARKFKKPFFIIIDRNLSKEDRKYLDEYFSKDNIISRMEVDIGNKSSTLYIANEIKKLVRELRIAEDYKGVTMTTPYDDDEYDNDNIIDNDDNGDKQWNININNTSNIKVEKNGCKQSSNSLTKRLKD